MSLNKSFLRIDIFRHAFDSKLKHTLSEYLISTLSNMLGMNYASDHKLQTVEKDIQKYANDLANKLKNIIGEELVMEESFDMAMSLFVAALSPTMPNKEEPPNLATNKSAVVDIVANLCYPDGDMSPEEAKDLNIAMGDILASGSSSSILALIEKEPGMLRSLLQRRTSSKDILSTLTNASHSQGAQANIASDFAQFAGLALVGALGFAANFAAASVIGSVASVAVVPVTIVAVKYGSQIGEAIGSKMAEFDGEFKKHTSNLKEMVQNFVPTFKNPNLGKTNEVEKKK